MMWNKGPYVKLLPGWHNSNINSQANILLMGEPADQIVWTYNSYSEETYTGCEPETMK